MEKIVLELPIYTFNIDYNGHVSNIIYVQWMEICRSEFFKLIGLPLQSLTEQGFFPVLAETQVIYKLPVYYGETVRAEMWLSELAKVYCWMEFRFFKGDEALVATGRQKGVFVDAQTLRPMRLTEELRQRFEQFLQFEANAK